MILEITSKDLQGTTVTLSRQVLRENITGDAKIVYSLLWGLTKSDKQAIRITNKTIADHLGLATESVGRMINVMVRKNMIRCENNGKARVMYTLQKIDWLNDPKPKEYKF